MNNQGITPKPMEAQCLECGGRMHNFVLLHAESCSSQSASVDADHSLPLTPNDTEIDEILKKVAFSQSMQVWPNLDAKAFEVAKAALSKLIDKARIEELRLLSEFEVEGIGIILGRHKRSFKDRLTQLTDKVGN